jgi:monoamine oxidase
MENPGKKRYSRSTFLGIGATGALAACAGGAPATTPLVPFVNNDLIVVGAGISGIAAARVAQSYGAKVLVLEAQSYIGGRTLTDNTTFQEVPFDLGAQFFQQVLSGNELLAIANAEGLPTRVWSSPNGGIPEYLFEGPTVLANSDPDALGFAATTVAMKAAVIAYGAAASLSGSGTDQPLSATVGGLAGLPFYADALGQNVLDVMGSVNNSTIDLYNFNVVSPAPFFTPGDDYLIRSGMGNFVAGLAKGLTVLTNTPVKSIATSAGGTATVTTAAGQNYSAKTVIVTASTGVLAANGISFSPALPAAYTQAFAALPLNPIYKALLGFNTSGGFSFTPKVPGFSAVLPLGSPSHATFFVRFWDTNTVEFLADADVALQLETGGPAYQRSILLPALDAAFPGAAAAWDGRMSQSSWSLNPYVRGAYAAAITGQVGARTLLAQPIANQLWFAGEALGVGGSRGTLHGAYRTGIAAGTAAMRTVGLASAARSAR